MNLKKIKDGAGASYTIESEILSVGKVNSLKVKSYDISYNTVIVDCDIDATCLIKSAYSYSEGGEVNAEASCKITSFEYQFYYTNDLEELFGIHEDEVEDFLTNHSEAEIIKSINTEYLLSEFKGSVEGLDVKCRYGGGWSHSKYDGTVSDLNSKFESYNLIELDARIEDSQILNFIDRLVTGETKITTYVVRMSGDVVETYENSQTCISMAKEIARENPGMDIEALEEFEEMDIEGNVEFIDSEVLWSNY